MDSSLFVGSAVRNKELLERFGMIGPALVDLAITHDMGHSICQEKNERRADDYGKELREGKTPSCGKAERGNLSNDTNNVATTSPGNTPR